MSLRPDELRSLDAETERCDECFHLKALHNSDNEYGLECRVGACPCDGRLPRYGPRAFSPFLDAQDAARGEVKGIEPGYFRELPWFAGYAGLDDFGRAAFAAVRESPKLAKEAKP